MGANYDKQNSSSQGSGWNAGNTGGVNGGVNGSYGANQSNQSSSGSSSQDVWGTQTPYLEDVYSNAQGQYGQAIDNINAMQPGVQDQITGALDQAQSGYGNQMGGGFAAGLQGQIGPNSYTDAMKGQIADDAMRMQQQSLGGLDARAAASGMSGSSGYRQQVNGAMDDINRNAQNAMANVGYQSFDRGVQNNLNVANMMDRNQMGAMSQLGAIQQGAMNQFNPQMAGLNAAGAYGQIIGGPTTLTQSQQSSNGFSNGFNSGFGMNGGYNYGNNYGGQMNNSSGSGRGYGLDIG